GTKSLHRHEPCNPGAHGMDNSPSTPKRADGHRTLTCDNDPKWNMKVFTAKSVRIQESGDHPHGFLCVVATVPQRIERSRNELKVAEKPVDTGGGRTNESPGYQED